MWRVRLRLQPCSLARAETLVIEIRDKEVRDGGAGASLELEWGGGGSGLRGGGCSGSQPNLAADVLWDLTQVLLLPGPRLSHLSSGLTGRGG